MSNWKAGHRSLSAQKQDLLWATDYTGVDGQ